MLFGIRHQGALVSREREIVYLNVALLKSFPNLENLHVKMETQNPAPWYVVLSTERAFCMGTACRTQYFNEIPIQKASSINRTIGESNQSRDSCMQPQSEIVQYKKSEFIYQMDYKKIQGFRIMLCGLDVFVMDNVPDRSRTLGSELSQAPGWVQGLNEQCSCSSMAITSPKATFQIFSLQNAIVKCFLDLKWPVAYTHWQSLVVDTRLLSQPIQFCGGSQIACPFSNA